MARVQHWTLSKNFGEENSISHERKMKGKVDNSSRPEPCHLLAGREGIKVITFSHNFLCLGGCLVVLNSYSFITREKVHNTIYLSSDGSGTRNLGFGFWKCHGQMG